MSECNVSSNRNNGMECTEDKISEEKCLGIRKHIKQRVRDLIRIYNQERIISVII